MHKSIATINSPEFINLKPMDISPLMSECEIKVLYLGENRNHSFINEEVALEMAKTLRGAPIVGYYKSEKGDFADHGNRMILDDEGIKCECMTKPYGFVSPNAKVWFQTFEDTDEFGNTETRKYLMTTGYLWTGQFEECKLAIQEGRPHSMELDEETLKGHWAKNSKNDIEFFIINDAVFSKLCILGDDVEPCFEGSSVTAPKVSSGFTKVDAEFKKTLFSMMQELQFALQGEQQMEEEVKVTETEEEIQVSPEGAEAAVEVENAETVAANEGEFVASEENVETVQEVEEIPTEAVVAEDYTKDEEEEEKEEEPETEEKSDAPAEEGEAKENEEEDKDEKKKYSLLEAEFDALTEKYSELEKKYSELVEFKAQVEDAQKDAMIAKFCFLSDEDKQEVIENKSKYSLEEIESKLSVICVRKQVNFNLGNDSKNDNILENSVVTTFNVVEGVPVVPPWVTAVKNNQRK